MNNVFDGIAVTTMKPIAVLRKFFGMKPNQKIAGFAAELKALSDEEKKELVNLAAVELGVAVDWPKV